MDSVIDQYIDENMALYNGDSAEILKGIPDDSIHFMILLFYTIAVVIY